ncbi:MAG: trehalose-6-phosphate synthase [Patescibacteria group bacterium]|nr:trehalose-6-phosphate synthase [Patescibacteria group bacterium]
MISAEELIRFVRKNLKNKKIVVAIQREPYIHIKTPSGIELQKTAGGAHILLDGILRKIGGLMVAIGSGSADSLTCDEKGRILVPPGEESYVLKRIFLKKKELDGWYYGFANQTLWPLCHAVFVKPIFNAIWWQDYISVNEKFSQAIMEELRDQEAFIWINDYHLALLPRILKNQNPNLIIGFFWHIPWPTYEIFRICPWKKQLLDGLLGSDFIGFHRGYHVDNFIEATRQELGVIVDTEPPLVEYQNHETKLANLPAGIDYQEIKTHLEKYKKIDKGLIKHDFGFDYQYLAIGVDRIDYTKGIIERLRIIDRFLEKYSDFQGKFVYLSIGAPSRMHISAYKNLNREIFDLVEKINWKYSTADWQPIYFINKTLPREKILAYFQLANVCLVTALDDGMNLVAKEYVICTKDDHGMLLLSKFTGAAKDLKSCLLINPYDIEGTADALYVALTMKPEEKIKRNQQMKKFLKENNIYHWGINFIQNIIQ